MRSWPIEIGVPVTRWATLVKVTRRDGQVFGFAGHDRDVEFDGLTYEAGTGFDASSLQNTAGTGVDHLEATAIVQTGRITGPEIRAGVWDAAKVELFWVEWDSLDDRGILVTGTIGEIREAEGEITVEVRSLSQQLSQRIGQECSAMCRVKNFPDDCFISAAGVAGTNYDGTKTVADYSFAGAVVTAAESPRILRFDGPTTPAGGELKGSGFYKHGLVTFTSGPNAGFVMDVKEHTIVSGEARIELQRAFPYAVLAGHLATLKGGCNRTLSQCAGTHQNGGNYNGEPHVPGDESMSVTGRKGVTGSMFERLARGQRRRA